MLQQGNEQLVSKGRVVTKSSSGMKKLGASVAKPLNRFSKEGLIRYAISLPLNALPVVGTVLFLLYNGTYPYFFPPKLVINSKWLTVLGIKAGPGFHARYFQLKGLDKDARESFVERRRGAYTAFGTAALALNLVPLAGLVFGITSTVGAALWASELEKQGRQRDGGGQSAHHDSEVQVEM